MDSFLKEKVIDKGLCIGCGVCSFINPNKYETVLNSFGMFEAVEKSQTEPSKEETYLCPFSPKALSEAEVSKKLFYENGIQKYDDVCGYNLNAYVGHTLSHGLREGGSSGGGTTWICSQLLEKGLVDAVIHVREATYNDELDYEYNISENFDDLLSGQKSKYYPISLNEVLNKIDENKKYALIGVPCFIKSMRLLASSNSLIKNAIKFYIGIICGHLKSTAFSDLMALHANVKLKERGVVDFRLKTPSGDAHEYSSRVFYREKNLYHDTNSVRDLYGCDWGVGYFKYKACDFCDDVFAELADIVIGDAWVPPYNSDWKGDNVVLTRNNILDGIIQNGIVEKLLKFDKVDLLKVKETQAASIRHKRNDIHIRILEDNGVDLVKRSSNSNNNSPRKAVQVARAKLRDSSHINFKIAKESSNVLKKFEFLMRSDLNQYRKAKGEGLVRFVPENLRLYIRKLKYKISKVLGG